MRDLERSTIVINHFLYLTMFIKWLMDHQKINCSKESEFDSLVEQFLPEKKYLVAFTNKNVYVRSTFMPLLLCLK